MRGEAFGLNLEIGGGFRDAEFLGVKRRDVGGVGGG